MLLTGASGFVGGHMARQASAAGVNLHLLGRTMAGPSEAPFHGADLTDRERVHAVVATVEPEVVMHLAAPGVAFGTADFLEMVRVQALGTEALLSACANLARPPHVILVGTGFEYCPKDRPIREEDPTIPSASRYGAAKAAASAVAGGFAGQLPMSLLRPFNLYGAGDRGPRLGNTLVAVARNGGTLKVSAGEQIRDFLHIDDFCALAWQVAERPAADGSMRICNVGSGESRPLREFVETIIQALEQEGMPVLAEFGAIPYRHGEPMMAVPDISRLKAEFDWRPRVPFAEGIADFVRWELAR